MKRIMMSVKEVAVYLGVSVTTIYTMARKSEIPHIKVRGRILFNRSVIEDWTRGEYQESKRVEGTVDEQNIVMKD